MNNLRIAVVGIGNMGSAHAKHIYDGAVTGMELAAVCDADDAKLDWARKSLVDIACYKDYHKLLDDHICDAIIIATPHYLHPVIATEGFEKGYHVLSEKPAGVYTKQVRIMNEAAEKSGKVFSLMLNHRTNPLYQKVRQLVQEGAIGVPKRFVWIITNWYRTQAYYNSGSWRATWAGEGGGVLLNQCPHQLDLWQWIFGMPKTVNAKCTIGKYHNIEVEDDVTITVEYENGACGCFITSTGEFPGTNRLEISGDLGKIVVEDQKLSFWKLDIPEREFCFTATEGFAPIPMTYEEMEINDYGTEHLGILQNFADAILKGEPLLSSGYDGINSLMISNAALLSSWTNQEITLPIDEDLYYQLLQEKISQSGTVADLASSRVENVDGIYYVRWQGKGGA